MKQINKFRPSIRSRHPSHSILRSRFKKLPLMPFRSVIRLGSLTNVVDTIEKGGNRVELNEIHAIENSSNKLLMKRCFSESSVITAQWFTYNIPSGFEDGEKNYSLDTLPYPIISKSHFGSRGRGNKKHNDKKSLELWMKNKNMSRYIFEKYYNYNREYRLHISEEGCFYTCRKMMKSDTPDEKKWFRNNSNSVWILEENDSFDRPINWDEIVKESIKSLKSVGLDFGAVDLRIQSAKDKNNKIRKNPNFIIIEINSAPSFGNVTSQKYIEFLPKLLKKKHELTSI